MCKWWHRAVLADVSHSRGCGAAAGVDVLSAEEVMMVAWVVDTAARERLAAFTAGAWPGLPNLLASHHLQGLLRLDAGASPSPVRTPPPLLTPPPSHGSCFSFAVLMLFLTLSIRTRVKGHMCSPCRFR